jgi:hypothetical protein
MLETAPSFVRSLPIHTFTASRGVPKAYCSGTARLAEGSNVPRDWGAWRPLTILLLGSFHATCRVGLLLSRFGSFSRLGRLLFRPMPKLNPFKPANEERRLPTGNNNSHTRHVKLLLSTNVIEHTP